jgi:hypothetical protein
LASAGHLGAALARVHGSARKADGGSTAAYTLLRIGLDDWVRGAVESGLGAMRALHGKRGSRPSSMA